MKYFLLIFLTLIVWSESAEKVVKYQISVDDEICQNQLNLFTDALEKREFWALELFDTWAKVDAGLLKGNIQNLGNFDGCMEFRHETQSNGIIEGKYCLVMFEALANSTLEEDFVGFDWREL